MRSHVQRETNSEGQLNVALNRFFEPRTKAKTEKKTTSIYTTNPEVYLICLQQSLTSL